MYRILTFIFMVCGLWADCQQLSFTQYTVKDGLPGSIVYHSLQDKNGFIWFATNQGVSRFDGKTFKNFSEEDGLPDNEILKLYLDRYNNVWFISLEGTPSIFYKGAIHRLDDCKGVFAIVEDFISDSVYLLSEYIKDNKHYLGYYQSPDTPGRWRFKDSTRVAYPNDYPTPMLRVSSGNKINFYFSHGNHTGYILNIKNERRVIKRYLSRNYYKSDLITDKRSIISLAADNTSILFFSNLLYVADSARIQSVLSLKSLQLKVNDLNSLYAENDSTLWLCTRNKGLIRISNFMSRKRVIKSFFPEAFCTSILKDREGSYWVTTHNDGVYYLADLDSYCISGSSNLAGKDAKCIQAVDQNILIAGFANGNILMINQHTSKNTLFRHWGNENKNNRILDIQPDGPHQFLVASDYGIDLLSGGNTRQKFSALKSIKNIFILKDKTLLFASAEGVHAISIHNRHFTTIFGQRATCINGIGSNYYWGTLNGLYSSSNNSIRKLGNTVPALCGIINHIDIGTDSTLWISTQQGIVVLKNGCITPIRREQGLLSDMCKHVLISGNVAWVSTNRGISRIAFEWNHSRPVYAISNITENDGLISNDVNQTAIAGNYVWAATTRGISCFSKDYIPCSMQQPLINVNTVVKGNKETMNADTVSIDYKNNKLLVGLSGISFRSGKQISYQYRLKDLDSNWTNTTINLLEFSTLPFGTHTFEARAVDRWGMKSSQVNRIIFYISAPFWRTSWFIFSTYLFTAILIGAIIYSYLKGQNQKKEKEFNLKNKMADLEMSALRAQMNPHFIFNCLSSIQHYILRADIKNSNLYLHKFSTLIRKILQHSANSQISLAEEISLLNLYMELEKLRLSERMDYSIEVADDLSPTELLIPSMILQPFVENAIKHGISPLNNKKGTIHVNFRRSGNYLICTIDDNGIGIHASVREQRVTFQEHKSLGLGITENRIKIINTIKRDKMSLIIKDKLENGSEEHGTIVQINFLIK